MWKTNTKVSEEQNTVIFIVTVVRISNLTKLYFPNKPEYNPTIQMLIQTYSVFSDINLGSGRHRPTFHGLLSKKAQNR
jgi:hypothetical protein